MSIEYQLAWPCPHITIEEVVSLGTDQRSLQVRQPIASLGTVNITINDDTRLSIPRNGLFSAAVLSSFVSGPFDIKPNEDTLTITTSGGSRTLSFGVTSVTRRTTDQVVKLIQKSGWDHVSVSNDHGYLVCIDTQTVGPHAFVKVSGAAAAALGFGQPQVSDRQWRAYGREVYPGWDLYLRPDEITNRFIRFRKPIQGNPLVKVTYAAPVSRCLRCQATFVENDFRFDATGSSIFIQNEDLLYQAVLKMLLTDVGSNPFHAWYGTSIREGIGTKALMGVSSVLSEDVRKALANLQSLQTEQAKYQQVTFKERLYAVLGVQVRRHQQDPSTFLIDVTVQNASATPISLNIVYTVPEVVALMGSNGLLLGNQVTGVSPEETRTLFNGDRNTLSGDQ
jgi:hypothetical protein